MAQGSAFATLQQQPAAAQLCLPTIISILEHSASALQSFDQATPALSTAFPVVLVPVFEQIATRRQACDELLPLLRRFMTQQSGQHGVIACAAVLQPVIILAALKAAGMKGYIFCLHPCVVDCALARSDGADHTVCDNGIQASMLHLAECSVECVGNNVV